MNIGECEPKPSQATQVLEYGCIYIFTCEYALRLLTVHSVRFELLDENFLEALLTGDDVGLKPRVLDGPLTTTVKFVLAPSSLVDLVSILPSWLERLT